MLFREIDSALQNRNERCERVHIGVGIIETASSFAPDFQHARVFQNLQVPRHRWPRQARAPLNVANPQPCGRGGRKYLIHNVQAVLVAQSGKHWPTVAEIGHKSAEIFFGVHRFFCKNTPLFGNVFIGKDFRYRSGAFQNFGNSFRNSYCGRFLFSIYFC